MSDAADFPFEGMELTNILVVSDLARATAFYRDEIWLENTNGTSAVSQFKDAWRLLVTPRGPTDDKPWVTFAPLLMPTGFPTP